MRYQLLASRIHIHSAGDQCLTIIYYMDLCLVKDPYNMVFFYRILEGCYCSCLSYLETKPVRVEIALIASPISIVSRARRGMLGRSLFSLDFIFRKMQVAIVHINEISDHYASPLIFWFKRPFSFFMPPNT